MAADQDALFLSIKPRFVEMLVAGTKTVELRRRRPLAAQPGGLVLVYASAPRMELVGSARIQRVDVGAPEVIWNEHQERVGLSRGEFDTYYHGAETATALVLRDIRPRPAGAMTLGELRRIWTGFSPPQSYRYIDAATWAAIL